MTRGFFKDALSIRKADALDTLDRVLGVQSCLKSEKVAALREIEKTAKRMADQIERHMRVHGEGHPLDEGGENWRPNSSHV